MSVAYERGLHEIGNGLFAYLQPDGGYGWSNAGLVVSDGTSLLVDTLFDLACMRRMLAAMEPVIGSSPIGAAINTHGDADHCWGNQLLPADARIYATSAAIAELQELTPAMVGTLRAGGLGPDVDEFVEFVFAPFEFADIEVRAPDEAIDSHRTLEVGGRYVDFIPVGPAHTKGDAVCHVADAGVVFTGDVVFATGTPVTWEGPLSRWLGTTDRILALDPALVVPGHGPLTDAAGVRGVQQYLRFVDGEARRRHEAGMAFDAAVDDIDLGGFLDLQYAERLVPNVDAVYRELEPDAPRRSRVELLALMGAYRKRHGLR